MREEKRWTAEYYTDARGKAPVLEFIDSLPDQEQAELVRAVGLLEEFGIYLKMPHARPVAGLWELRAGAGRLL